MWIQITYILQVQLCFTLLWLFYRVTLHRNVCFLLSRIFLVGMVPVSLLLPLVSIPVFPVEAVPMELASGSLPESTALPRTENLVLPSKTMLWVARNFTVKSIFLGFSFLGTLFLAMLMLLSILPWLKMALVSRTPLLDNIRFIYTRKIDNAGSLFRFVFINRIRFDEEQYLHLVKHELMHVRLGHSWDILVAQIYRVIFWWNPIIWLWYRSIREIHEYQADAYALGQAHNPKSYIILLVEQLTGIEPEFVSSYSYSLAKKRLCMLTRTTQKTANWRIGLAIPVLAGLLALFGFSEYPVYTSDLEVQHYSYGTIEPQFTPDSGAPEEPESSETRRVVNTGLISDDVMELTDVEPDHPETETDEPFHQTVGNQPTMREWRKENIRSVQMAASTRELLGLDEPEDNKLSSIEAVQPISLSAHATTGLSVGDGAVFEESAEIRSDIPTLSRNNLQVVQMDGKRTPEVKLLTRIAKLQTAKRRNDKELQEAIAALERYYQKSNQTPQNYQISYFPQGDVDRLCQDVNYHKTGTKLSDEKLASITPDKVDKVLLFQDEVQGFHIVITVKETT